MADNFVLYEDVEPASPIEAGQKRSSSEAPSGGVASRFLQNVSTGYSPSDIAKAAASTIPVAVTAAAESVPTLLNIAPNALARFGKYRQDVEAEAAANPQDRPVMADVFRDFSVPRSLADMGSSEANTALLQGLSEWRNRIKQFKEEELPKVSTLNPEGFTSKVSEIGGSLPFGAIQANPVLAYVSGYGAGGYGEGLKQAATALGGEAVMKTLQGSPAAWKLINDQAKKMGLRDVTRDNIESILTSSASQRIGSALVNAAITGYEGGGVTDVMAAMFTGGIMPTGKMKPEYKNRLRTNIREAANDAMGVKNSGSAEAVAIKDPDMTIDVIVDRMKGIKDGSLTLANRDDTVTARKPETVFELIKLGADRTKQLNEQQKAIASQLQGDAVQPQLVEHALEPLNKHFNDVAVRAKTDPTMRKAVEAAKQAQTIMESVLQGGANVDRLNAAAKILDKYADTLDLSRPGDIYDAMGKSIRKDETAAWIAANKKAFDPITGELTGPLPTKDPGLKTITGELQKSANLANQAAGARDMGLSRDISKLKKPAQGEIVEQLIDISQDKAKFLEGDPIRAIANELRRVANIRGEVVDLMPQAQTLRAEAESTAAKSKSGASKRLLDAAAELEKVRYKPIDEVLSDITALNAESATYFKSKEVGNDATANADQYARGLQLKALQTALKQKLSQIDPAMGEEFNANRENMRKQIEVDSLLTDTYIKAAGDTSRTSGFTSLFHRGSEATAAYALWSLFTKSKDSKIIKAFNNAEKLVDLESGNAKVDKFKPSIAPAMTYESDQELY